MIPLTLLSPQTNLSSNPDLATAKHIEASLAVSVQPVPDWDQEVMEPLRVARAKAAQRAAEEAARAQAVPITVPRVVAAPRVYPQPTEGYKAFIYNHESGNDPQRWNSSGCVGLGQACPASKLLAVCPNLDYACEDAFFTNYAISRYDSWQGAYTFWTQNRWW